ncbi:nucleotidyltransferase [Metabacillus herbersteinensis]|uniref:tRNA(Met) cytidine acetate ligase n=1 Tax=Metabacillus herbersteinensis TaxID=283816 RepID=A0ABV6GBY6_9BACI
MKALGVVVEYNPFHNGHLYHLQQSVKETDADAVVAVMSGNFLQRGEPALVSKWTRTKMALLGGVDVVVELPYAFATQKAEIFASGAVSLLESLKCDSLCFGSELGEIEPFLHTYEHIQNHLDSYNKLIKENMKLGVSYPKASSLAFQEIATNQQVIDLSLPNNILGFHYVKAMIVQKTMMKPATIKRTAAGYHDQSFSSATIASATSIRKALFSNDEQSLTKNFVPETTWSCLDDYNRTNTILHNWEHYFQLLKYKIVTMSKQQLLEIYEMEEGLENRVATSIQNATSFQEFMEKLKTKRYTWTRLQRLCTHLLTNTTKQQMKSVETDVKAPYIRLLGMSQKGQHYLNTVKKDLDVPLIAKLSSLENHLLDLDIKAAQTYQMVFTEPLRSKLLQKEYATPPLRFNEMDGSFSE